MSTTTVVQVQAAPALLSSFLTDASYWWHTTGTDLARMLQEADYPEATRRAFLDFYKNVLCPQLGGRPAPDAGVACMSWDGTPFEYSFELRGSTTKLAVRFSIDLTQLRPTHPEYPLNINATQAVVDVLSERTVGFHNTWYESIKSSLVQSHLSPSAQHALVQKTGYYTQVALGFDIATEAPPEQPDALPVLAKVYFPPCFAAARHGITRWDVVQSAIQRLPGIQQLPNILCALRLIDDFLVATGVDEYRNGPRYLATDFVAPEQSRLKIYFRHPFKDFESAWDFYTLGGRIPGLEGDKDMFRDLITMAGDTTTGRMQDEDGAMPHYTTVNRKMTCIYFSLSARNPIPVPKINFYPRNVAKNDQVITRGVDQWLKKYGWYDGGKSMEERTQNVL